LEEGSPESGSDEKKVKQLESECSALRESILKVELMLQLTRRVNKKKIKHLGKNRTLCRSYIKNEPIVQPTSKVKKKIKLLDSCRALCRSLTKPKQMLQPTRRVNKKIKHLGKRRS